MAIATVGCSGWDARSEPKRRVVPLREARAKADRPNSYRPFGLLPNALSASPGSLARRLGYDLRRPSRIHPHWAVQRDRHSSAEAP